MRVMGIDEAGRGPVIGSMYMAGVVIDKKDEKLLKRWGVKDSKLLTAEKREELFDKIVKRFDHKIIKITPQQIDEAMIEGSLSNLNWLEADNQAKIINEFEVDRAVIDCPSRNVNSFAEYLQRKVTTQAVLIVENKADLNHVVVGAASILAKVSRDRDMAQLRKKIGFDFGSGYLTDPKTLPFLEKHWKDYPEIFRTKWAPYKALVIQSAQSSLSSFSKKNI